MKKNKILFISIILIQFFVILFIINKYENDLLKKEFRIEDGLKRKNYNAQETLTMIKSLPDYLGDSVVIYEDGTFKSLTPEINRGILNIYENKEQLNYYKSMAKTENLPLPFVIYRNLTQYYKPKK